VTGRRQVVDAVLRIVAEPAPAAYYGCSICPFTASVKGRRKVAEFAGTIRNSHRANCPNLHRTERNRAA
jgi:hypothetical protein